MCVCVCVWYNETYCPSSPVSVVFHNVKYCNQDVWPLLVLGY